jgi:hypothetical protein
MASPLWSTPQRRQHLVKLFHQYGNKCLRGHPVCRDTSHYDTRDVKMVWESEEKWQEGRNEYGEPTGVYQRVRKSKKVPFYSEPYPARLYNKVAEACIESWKAEDRERRSFEWKLEQQTLHDGTYGKYGSTFDPVARDVFFSTRPEYYLVAMGVNAFSFDRVALIRIPSTSVHLFVDVGGAVQEVSKNARRKALRHRKLSGALKDKIDENCKAAVRAWHANR